MNDSDIQYVCTLVEKAGHLAVGMREGVEIALKSGPDDKVTAADIALSKMISEGLSQRFANDCVVSEEDKEHLFEPDNSRVWVIDPIDGTQNYILDDGQYCVMIGLMVDCRPSFGWVYAPTTGDLYYGGPGFGAFHKAEGDTEAKQIPTLTPMEMHGGVRLLMGSRDRKAHPWVTDLDNVSLVKTGSIGLKVGRILDGRADVFAHLSRKLKVWDTAGPAAIALGAGLEVGTLEESGDEESGQLAFPLPAIIHDTTVVMGRSGALQWCRKHLIRSYQKQ